MKWTAYKNKATKEVKDAINDNAWPLISLLWKVGWVRGEQHTSGELNRRSYSSWSTNAESRGARAVELPRFFSAEKKLKFQNSNFYFGAFKLRIEIENMKILNCAHWKNSAWWRCGNVLQRFNKCNISFKYCKFTNEERCLLSAEPKISLQN